MSGLPTLESAASGYRPGPQHHAVAALLDRMRSGGAACVVTGEPGCGRSAFLTFAARSFDAGPVIAVRADPARTRQQYAGVRALCGAVGAPAARGPGSVPELLGALEATAAPGPVLVCVDDAHLWDPGSRAVLGQLAARLPAASRVALLLTVAGHRPVDAEFAGLPLLRLASLTPPDAAALLDEAAPGTLDPGVRAEITAEAEGNPALLLRLLHRLTPAQLRGHTPLPRPLADAGTLTALTGRHLTGPPPSRRDLLLTVAAAVAASGEPLVEAGLVLRALARLSTAPPPLDPLPELLDLTDGRLGFRSTLLRRTVYAGAPAERRRATHDALARAYPDGRDLIPLLHRSWADAAPNPALAAVLSSAAADPATGAPPALRCRAHTRAAELTPDGLPQLRRYTDAAEQALLAGQPARALQLLDAARDRPAPLPVRARAELLRGMALWGDGPVDDARETLLFAAALLAPHDPERSGAAVLTAAEAAWAAGDVGECLRTLAIDRGECAVPGDGREAKAVGGDRGDACAGRDRGRAGLLVGADGTGGYGGTRGTGGAGDAGGSGSGHAVAEPSAPAAPPEPAAPAVPPEAAALAVPQEPAAQAVSREPAALAVPPELADPAVPFDPLRDHRAGMEAVLQGRFDRAVTPLRRVVDQAVRTDEPERLLRSAAAALLLGDITAACRVGGRALAAARTRRFGAHEARALEYLAYGELRAGRHALARTHAEEGLRSAYRAGQRNTAAHHHAVLALAASIEGDRSTVTEHVSAALSIARRHGLAQAATLAQWAAARADLGGGRPREAADRLGPLVRPGARRGHFAVWMLAVPCFVEASALAGQPDHALAAVEDFALWAACDADPQAPAQLLRCRALLAPHDAADPLYRQALRRHEEAAGDFERARTELLYGKWLRRRRRPGEARSHLRAALLGFERCGARPWAQQAAAELRANGEAGTAEATTPPGAEQGALARLTPQQLRIARCVAEGATNREVALSLSVSNRTVDYHLRNVFAALGVRSRVELARFIEQVEKTAAHP
ncbi:LuxR C-terminal-related transcriptional regulator [Streptomyces sp. NPDC048521]|uniref:helix-turn-helix transcriptional regulator n=1 Tax=Streptomyces sp. NPDC048521 TaxID=3365566 RepID=UPI00371C9B0A